MFAVAPMSTPRSRVAQLLLAVPVAGVAFAWLRHQLFVEATALAVVANLILLVFASIRVFRTDPPSVFFWVGYALFGWAYAGHIYQNSADVLFWCINHPTGIFLDRFPGWAADLQSLCGVRYAVSEHRGAAARHIGANRP